jgi:hypothetical protein
MEKQIIERALSVIEELQIKLIIAFLLLMLVGIVFVFGMMLYDFFIV